MRIPQQPASCLLQSFSWDAPWMVRPGSRFLWVGIMEGGRLIACHMPGCRSLGTCLEVLLVPETVLCISTLLYVCQPACLLKNIHHENGTLLQLGHWAYY